MSNQFNANSIVDVGELGVLVKTACEIHVFVEPLNPSPAEAESFARLCRTWRADETDPMKQMRGLHLMLDVEQQNRGREFIGVLMTSAYSLEGGLPMAKAICTENAEFLRGHGYKVIRQKIEAKVDERGELSVPQTRAEEREIEARIGRGECRTAAPYFEFHIKIGSRNGEPIDNEDVVKLREISDGLARELRISVPLSYNALRPGQRFINGRTYGVGGKESRRIVDRLVDSIESTRTLRSEGTILEYIVYDDFKSLDKGFLEPLL